MQMCILTTYIATLLFIVMLCFYYCWSILVKTLCLRINKKIEIIHITLA